MEGVASLEDSESKDEKTVVRSDGRSSLPELSPPAPPSSSYEAKMLAEYVPQPVKDFYAGFPLVTLPEAYSPHRVQAPTTPELWVRLPFPLPLLSSTKTLTQTRSLPSCLGVT